MNHTIQKQNRDLKDVYHGALRHGNRDGAKTALMTMYNNCDHKNGHCLKELFCPDWSLYIPAKAES